MISYETFEHEADMGIRGFGRTIEEAFSHAASALYSIMVDVKAVEPRERREVRVEAGDPELLLLEWLNGLLALSDIERMVFSRFQVRIAGSSLEGEAWGEALDRDRHKAHVEVKAATLHMLRVVEEQGRFVAQCVVDV